MVVCCYCCEEKKLIKAHIIPESFWEIDKTQALPLKAYTNIKEIYPKKVPIGIYDTNILCANCDGWIGKEFDEYATVNLLRVVPDEKFIDQKKIIWSCLLN